MDVHTRSHLPQADTAAERADTMADQTDAAFYKAAEATVRNRDSLNAHYTQRAMALYPTHECIERYMQLSETIAITDWLHDARATHCVQCPHKTRSQQPSLHRVPLREGEAHAMITSPLHPLPSATIHCIQ